MKTTPLRTQFPDFDWASLQPILDARHQALLRPFWQEVREIIEKLEVPSEVSFDCQDGVVRFGDQSSLDAANRRLLGNLLERLKPWRKGPFCIAGEFLDAEWRSDLKWARISPALPPLAGLSLLDVGCNNGYYLFRAALHGASRENPPEFLLGIDPSEAFFFAFSLFQKFSRHPRLFYELLGVEHLPGMKNSFDIALCLGIIYHQRDPLGCLERVRESLKPGGRAIIESQTIPGDGSQALFPPGRYAKAHNVYFIPTRDALYSLMLRAGFKRIELLAHTPVTTEEQRRTKHMNFESYVDFLDPKNSNLTVEGHPAPWRTAFVGYRG